MRRRILLTMFAVAALALPAGALADHGGGGGGGGGRTYELKGTLSAYTPAAGATNGSITIHVTKANGAGQPFVGMTLTFPVSSATEVEAESGTITNGDSGEVKVKGAATTDPAVLQAMTPRQIEDHGMQAGGGGQTTYELKGTLSAFTPAAGATNGSITIHVTKANGAGQPFVGMTLTFPVASTTQVDPFGAAIANGDKGEVQIKGAPGLDATGLQLLAPKEIEDESIGGDD